MDERLYYLAFSLVNGIGDVRFNKLIKHFGSAKKAWQAKKADFKEIGISEKVFNDFEKFRNSFDINKYLERLKSRSISFITLKDDIYPHLLRQIDLPPAVLYLKGKIEDINWTKTLAIVGTRRVTVYGREVTEKLASDLVSCGFTIVSGLAFGVDAIAHKTSINNKGKTIAILGCGVDSCYPRENQRLYDEIIKDYGIIISEYPPGTIPSRGTFPARNRIISGLSSGVLVTEAGEDSGALITASYAASQGRPIFAVPGPITSKQSYGTAKLLKNGAVFIQNVDDILNHFKIKKNTIDIKELNLSKDESLIIELLSQEKLSIDELSKKTKIKITVLNIIVSMLEVKGLVKNSSGEIGIV